MDEFRNLKISQKGPLLKLGAGDFLWGGVEWGDVSLVKGMHYSQLKMCICFSFQILVEEYSPSAFFR